MATTAQSPAGTHQWSRSPSAHEALEAHYAANPDTRPEYPHKWDTSRSDSLATGACRRSGIRGCTGNQ